MNFHSKSFHDLHFNFKLRDETKEDTYNYTPLYITNTLRAFSISLIGLYIPIYIFSIAKSQNDFTNNSPIFWVIPVLLFYLIRSCGIISLLHSLVNLIFGKIKFKGSIVSSNIILALALYLMILSEDHLMYVYMAALLFGINTILYWIPFHTYFVRKSVPKGGHYGKQIGLRLFLASIATAAGPALGGLIIQQLGFGYLFGLGILILILSGFPILFSTQEHDHGKHNVMHIVRDRLFNHRYRFITIGQMSVGIDGELYAIFSPLLLFVVADNITNVGYITSLSVALAAAFTLIVGKFIDKHGAKKILRRSLIINALLYLPRIFVNKAFIIFSIDILDKINGSFLSVPLLAATYERAKADNNESDYMIYREFTIHLGICVAIILCITLMLLTNNWRFVFLLLAMISPLIFWISREKEAPTSKDT